MTKEIITMRPIIILFALLLALTGCHSPTIKDEGEDLTGIPYHPKPYNLSIPKGLTPSPWLDDHILTEEGVLLGKYLFYDPILSVDSTVSCATCHRPAESFSGGKGKSRMALTLLNVSYPRSGYGWDGRSKRLEEHISYMLNSTMYLQLPDAPLIQKRLISTAYYPKMFRKAFGIQNTTEINSKYIVAALSQFLNILLSGDSKYDKVVRGEMFFTPEEQDGADMFFDANPLLPDAECAHCHIPPLFYSERFANNGLDSVKNYRDFTDPGRGGITGISSDSGKFRIPTIRNVALKSSFMHDGRLQSLEEVIQFYNSGGHRFDNYSPFLHPLGLSEYQEHALLSFLQTLTDSKLRENPDIESPF